MNNTIVSIVIFLAFTIISFQTTGQKKNQYNSAHNSTEAINIVLDLNKEKQNHSKMPVDELLRRALGNYSYSADPELNRLYPKYSETLSTINKLDNAHHNVADGLKFLSPFSDMKYRVASSILTSGIDETLRKGLDENQEEREQAVKSLFAVYVASGNDLIGLDSREKLEMQFYKSWYLKKVLGRDFYDYEVLPMVNYEVLSTAMKMLEQNKDNLAGFQRELSNLNIDLDKAKDEMHEFSRQTAEIVAQEVRDFIAQLDEDQWEQMRDQVFANQSKLSNLEGGASEAINKIESIDNQVSQEELKALIQELGDMNLQMKRMKYQQMSPSEKLAVLNQGQFTELFGDLRGEIEQQKENVKRQFVTDLVNYGPAYLESGYAAATVLGLHGKDAENAQLAMGIANAGLNWLAAMYVSPWNYPTAVFSTIALFGKKEKKGPSIEEVLIRGLYARIDSLESHMHVRFNRVEERIDSLYSLNLKLYSYTMDFMEAAYKAQNGRFDRLETMIQIVHENSTWYNDRVYETTSGPLQTMFKKCIDLDEDRLATGNDLLTYEDLEALFNNPNCRECLNYLENVVTDVPIWVSETMTNSEVYQPASRAYSYSHQLFKYLINERSFALLSGSTDLSRNFLTLINADNILDTISTQEHLKLYPGDEYISPEVLMVAVGLFMEYDIYFELTSHSSGNFEWMTQKEVLMEPLKNKEIKQAYLLSRYEVLQRMIDKAIMQESLQSGALIMTYLRQMLYGNAFQLHKKDALKALEANPLMMQNFATYMLRVGLSMQHERSSMFDDYANLYNNADTACLEKLNQLVSLPNTKFEFDQGYLLLNMHGVRTLAPAPIDLQLNEMRYSDWYHKLKTLRVEVTNKLVSLEFNEAFMKEADFTPKKYLKWYKNRIKDSKRINKN